MGHPRLLVAAGRRRGDARPRAAVRARLRPDTVPAVVVHERTGGLTDDDLAAVADDAAEFGRLSELDGEVTGPIPSEDGEAAQLVVPLNAGADGREAITPLVDELRAEADDGRRAWTRGSPARPGTPRTPPPGDAALIEAALADPADSQAAYDTIERLRSARDDVSDGEALVGGNTAVHLDVQEASQRDNRVIVPLIMFVVLVLLAVLLRAVVAPLILIATVVVSFGAALGISALIFDAFLGVATTDSPFPLSVLVFLVALGIDYDIVLMTRVREEAHDHGTRPAALIGWRPPAGSSPRPGWCSRRPSPCWARCR